MASPKSKYDDGLAALIKSELEKQVKKDNSLDRAGKKPVAADIVYHGEKMILPEGMSIPSAIDLLKRRQEYLQTQVNMSDTFDVFPWDGANALHEVLTAKYGWAEGIPTPGFFGDSPPQMIRIEISPNVFKEVPWGRLSLPGVEGYLETGVSWKDKRMVFSLGASVLRKDEATVRNVFDAIRAYLKVHSIYRGQAVKIRFNDDNGKALRMPEPKFLDTSKIKESDIIYSEDVEKQIAVNLFTPIRRVQDCLDNGIRVKRGVLLGGTYGTGKTLAATVASKIAVDNGITYLYVPRADELSTAIEFAKQYQSPACVIFCEDIDRVLDGERSVEMDDILNIIDGLDSKNSNIIVVLTTNDLNAINPAMLRPGRLDAVIEVTAPDGRAVERLVRMYGGKSIEADTDLSDVGKSLAGQIPAVIAEVVNRAKLAQLAMLAPGERVEHISSEALLTSAHSMNAQLALLKAGCERKPDNTSFEDAFRKMLHEPIGEAVASIHETVGEIRERV